MLDPELHLGLVNTDTVLLAVVLLELRRLSEVVDRLEGERLGRLRSRSNRQAAALAAGQVLRSPGRPKKIATNGASPPA
jgi:hypothetical protein